MIILIVIGVLLLLLVSLLFLRIKFDFCLKDDLVVYLRILGLRIKLFPQKKKKPSAKKFKKGYPKEKTNDDTSAKEEAPASKEVKEKISTKYKISTVLSLIKLLLSRFFKHLRLDISRIIVVVGGKDAASCAISYGIISQSVAYLLAFLDDNLKIHKKRSGRIDILCDFTSEETVYDIYISASLNVWQILDIAITLVYNYFKGKDVFNIKKHLSGGNNKNG